jgi:hypothetical protein
LVDAANRANLLNRGALPWWSDAGLTIRFLRPIPSLLVWVDFQIAHYDAFRPHIHSLLWWVVAVAGAVELFLLLLGARAAFLAAVVFGLSPCHVVPIVWLADRNVLVTVALGTWALVSHVRGRESPRTRDAWRSLGLWTAVFLTGEYALCWTGYVLAFELFRAPEPMGRRVRGVAPFVLPAAAYVVVHAVLRYGAEGSGFYSDPVTHLASYAAQAPRAIAVLLGSAWFGFDENALAVAALGAVVPGGIALTAAVFFSFRTIVGVLPMHERRPEWWLLVGSLLAVVPLLATEPKPRLLGVAAVGVSAVTGIVLDRGVADLTALFKREPVRWSPDAWLLVLSLAATHFVLMPIRARRTMNGMLRDARIFEDRLAWIRTHVPRDATTIGVLRASVLPSVLWTPFMLGDSTAAQWRALTEGFDTVVAVRSGPRTLEMSGDRGAPLIPLHSRDVLRESSMEAGETIEVEGMRATVMAVDSSHRPTRVRYEFDRDLDAPSFWWISEGTAGFNEVRLPLVNVGVRIAP